MPVVAVRADGGFKIGMGHIIRTTALSLALLEMGCEVFYISSLDDGISYLKEKGFPVTQLTKAQLFNSEDILQVLKEKNADVLIVDSHNVPESFLNSFRGKVGKVVYIDDMNAFDQNVDFLINYSIGAKESSYKSGYKNRRMLLGPDYALLRQQFINLPRKAVNQEVREIMITSGATDDFSTILFFLDALLRDESIKKAKRNVIIGRAFKDVSEIESIAKKNNNIILHKNLSNISKVMLSSDIAISAGGSTLYELCACGTPALSYIIVKNQEASAIALSEKGYIECLGWYDKLTQDKILEGVNDLCADFEKRKEISQTMQKLIDGKGAKRAAQEFVGNRHACSEEGEKNV